ncbi:hypothetical protein SLA2020_410920 [Shorea laevis]
MEMGFVFKDSSWWLSLFWPALDAKTFLMYVFFSLLIDVVSLALLTWAFTVTRIAWKKGRSRKAVVSVALLTWAFTVTGVARKKGRNRKATLETGSFHAPFNEALILKNKSQEIEPYLNGRSIYLVGMMGSGKTTVGQILSQVVGYSFFDSDSLVEQEVDGTSVADIFKLYGECFFRDKETEVLHRLSLRRHIVVSTGGGAAIRSINWKYMSKGISVWLDAPLEALAERIAAVGTSSRPLLHHESGDAYMKTLRRLYSLYEERVEAYANANARVSLENIAAKLGHTDVSDLTPTAIAIETLEQIEGYLKEEW